MEITDHVHWGFRIQCSLLRILTLPHAKESNDGENNRLQESKG